MDNQQIQIVNNDSKLPTLPIFSFLEQRVQYRFSDASRAQIESKLTLERAKLRKENKSDDFELKVKLLSSKIVNNDFVIYKLRFIKGPVSWIFQTRYSLLYELNEKLPKTLKEKLPGFPEKKFFGNLEPAFLQKRFDGLQLFLEQLLIHGRQNEISKEFLRQSKIAAIEINDPSLVNNFKLDY